MEILIIGAGPTGLTAALELARRGILPEIVEERNAPSEISRAVGIMPASIDKLRPTGVSDAILREGMPFKKVMINRGGKCLMSLDFSKTAELEDVMIGLPQNRTEELMHEGLQKLGVEVKYGCAVDDIETDDEQATVAFEGGRSKTYQWVIAADGIQSTVRNKLKIPYHGYDLADTWSIADVDIGGGYDPELFSAWIQGGNEGVFTFILPIESKRLRIVSSTPDTLKSLPIKLDIQNIRRSGTFKISVRQAETYLKGRVLLAGDAAHCHSPVGGRGMNLGIDDAVAAAQAIMNDTTNSYSSARHLIGARVLKVSEKARKAITSRHSFVKAVVWFVLKLFHHVTFLQKTFLRQITRL